MSDDNVLLRVDGAGASLDVPARWTARDVSADELGDALAGIAGRVAIVVTEAAAARAIEAVDEAPEERMIGGVFVSQHAPEATAAGGEEGDAAPPAAGWPSALAARGATLDTGAWPALPEGLARLAPVRNVLESAGQFGRVTLPDGTGYVACGFPDLLRPQSKVLLVREGDPQPEVVALHRHPRRVGVVVFGDDGYLPSADLDPDPVAEERTGRALPEWGTLFAVEAAAVLVTRGGRVWRWDGRKEEDMGTPTQAMASLVLRWSQR
jgi:hypothetical protein